AAKAPELVYPNDGVLLPPNLNRLEIHFRPKVGTSLYQLTLANEVTDVKVHLACYRPAGVPEGCIYETDPAVWKAVAETNRGGAPVTLTVKATDANGAEVGTSASLTFSFARDDLEGGLYYWTTSEGGGIMRFDFADPTQTQAVKFVGNELSGGGCGVGCHALSRDGKKIVAQKGGSQSGDLLLLDVAKYEPIVPFPAAGKSVFESWSPDASQFAGVYAARASGNPSPSTDWNLRIHDGETGAVAASVAGTGSVEQPANHPDWSPDGRTIAYVKMGDRGSDLTISNQKFFGGALFTVSREGNAWSAPKLLLSAAAGKNRYYPAFAPDSSFVVFDESTCAAGQPKDRNCNADSDPSAKVFALSTAEGAAPIPLTQANAPGKLDANANLTNSFPKWSPFVFRRTSEGGRLNWLTFSSSRNYGLRTPVAGAPDENPRGTLLWMTAIDPDKVAAGQDPSYSAFALPFQDLNTSNHIGQWTEKVVPRIR
ncbi:MAG TPA: hypothetical protein VEY30_01535, partial [Myxococcaceae bacterium]|nr:hypothetical protein [Myxococcaceae bacterium]